MSRPRLALSIAAVALVLPIAAGAQAIEAGWPSAPVAAGSAPLHCAPIAFARAEISTGDSGKALVVTVEAVSPNEEIRLQPYLYVMQPEYWAIGVVACRSAAPSTESSRVVVAEMPIAGSIGRKGIEVLGGSGRSVKFDLQ